jgi:hypothetical protein
VRKLMTVKTSLLFVFVAVFAALEATAVIPVHVLQATSIDVTSGVGTTIPAGTLTPIGNLISVSCPGTSGPARYKLTCWRCWEDERNGDITTVIRSSSF